MIKSFDIDLWGRRFIITYLAVGIDDAAGADKYAGFGVLRSGFRSDLVSGEDRRDKQDGHVLVEHRWMLSRPGHARTSRPVLYYSRLYLKYRDLTPN